MGDERYTRPPLVGAESSERAAVWRFRLVLLVVLLIVAAAVGYLVRSAVTGSRQENPGVNASAVASGR